ncbi:ESX secretion-associated protein EspG [Amycolatopsis sp. NPDC049688]|uniref:ESX secretion-associated protein EspG n=1 Tax=Amycolatopsis sp. NPDC049688 TaxID=3154733 RepID=UPI003433369D
MPHSFSLSLAAVDILLEQLGLGRAPTPFEVPHVGTTVEQRAMIRDAVVRDLTGRGLWNRGRLDADAELALATFARGSVTIGAAAELGDRHLFARVASDGQFAVLAHQKENLIVFEEVRPTGIVPAIVDLLPLTPAAPGQSVTISRPVQQPRRRDDAYDPFAGVSAPRSHSGSGGPQVRMIERVFQEPKKRVGQFTAQTRGATHPPLAWFDTPSGRWLMSSRAAADGQRWITYAPADNARLAQQLYAQLEGQF